MTDPAFSRQTVRAASLCATALVCFVWASSATARADALRSDDALPCNALCRAWMSWTPDHKPSEAGRRLRIPEADETRHRPRGTVAEHPRPRTAARARLAREPKPLERDEAERGEKGEDAPATRARRPSPKVVRAVPEPVRAVPEVVRAEPVRVRPPRRPAIDNPKPAAVDAAAGRVSPPASDAVPAAVPPWQDDAADAAILARPLYQPPSAGPEATGSAVRRDEPAAGERPFAAAAVPGPSAAPPPAPLLAEEPPPAPGPATVGAVLDQPPHQPPQTPSAVPDATGSVVRRDEPAASGRPFAAAAVPGPSAVPPPAPLSAEIPPALLLPPAPALAPVPPPARAAADPALPASDLERLEDVEAPARPAPPASPRRPLIVMLLVGGLALLSLVGARRRRPAGDPP